MAAETGQSLGEFLRQEREKRGVTIEQVASATKIAVRLLHMLESDQYSEMPAKPFVRGFVISYSRFIGLDSKEVLTQFNDFIEQKAHDRPTRDQGHSGYAFERKETEQSRLVLSVVLGSFIVIGGILFFILKPTLHKKHKGRAEQLKAAHGQASPSPSDAMASPLVSASPAPSVSSVAAAPSPSPSPSVSAAPLVPSPSPSAAFVPPAKPIILINPNAKYVKPLPSPTPSPTPSQSAPVASPKPSPSLLPVVPVASASPALVPAASPSPSPAVSPAAIPTTSASDPLNSGMDMKKEDIKYKVIFRALEDVWVRYQSDNRKPMRFPLRKDKVLVLRAAESIRFQASDPKAIRFQYTGGARLLTEEKTAVMRQGDLTLIIPPQAAEKIKEAFPGAKTIFMSPVPPSAAERAKVQTGE